MGAETQNAIWDIETLQGTIGVIPYETMEREALKRAIKALEKQVPKKPKVMDGSLIGERFWWYCGHCGASRHTNTKSNHCSYCGGKVDWGKVE